MAGKSLLIATVSGSQNFNTASTTLYIAPTNAQLIMQPTEANVEITARKSANLSLLGLRINANSRTTTSTLNFRKNGANGNMNIAVAAGVTGYFEDTTNTDTLTAGDTFCFSWTNGSGTGSIFIVYTSALIESGGGATDPAHSYYGVHSATLLNSSLNANRWFSPGGSLVSASDTAASRFVVPADGVLSNLSCNVTVNAKAGSMTLRSRVNGGFGNQTMTIAAGATGKFEDTTNTDTIVSGDVINFQLTMSGSGNLTMTRVTAMFTGTQAMNATFVTGHGSNAHNAPRHMPFAGDTRINNGESTVDFNMPYGFTFSHLYAHASWTAANQLIKFRKNAADGNLVTTSAGVGAALLSDLTHSDTTVAGDNCNLISDPALTAIGLGHQSLRLTDPVSVLVSSQRTCLTHGA